MTRFLYDFAGNLIQQSDAGPTVNLTQSFILDDLTNVAYISRSNGDSVSVLTGRTTDQDLAVIHPNGQVEYKLGDAVNSTQATVDQSGKLVSSFSYEPFGKAKTTSTYPFQFTGRVPVNSGLYYYRARYYCPAVGRFISEDPLAQAGGTLLYKYASNNPVNRTDPSGLESYDSCYADCQEFVEKVQVIGCGIIALINPPIGFVCAVLEEFLKYEGCRWQCEPLKPPQPPPACPTS
jgi:RHS repeat-associated protein